MNYNNDNYSGYDYNRYNYNDPRNFNNKRSQEMETASLVLGIIAIASCTCLNVSIICGSLSMLFALLSKGGASSMSSRAMFCFVLGLVSVLISICFYTVLIVYMLHEYGSLSGILNAYSDMIGIDYNDLIEQINSAY
ncbi:MAG: hypothetical protein ACLS3P_05415 [Agathobacter sp.]|uniref:hypothetical protein n=1 Tax=Agathobacter sp. TaxID=2021311 RepID=UPI00399131A1